MRSHKTIWIAFSVLTLLATCLRTLATEMDLDHLLERVGKRVELFDEMFSQVTCTETVSQLKLNPGGKVIQQRKVSFDSLAMLQVNGNALIIEESKLPQGKVPKEKGEGKTFLVSEGFSVLLLIFHPIYQPGFEFTLSGQETLDGKALQIVRFRHLQGSRSPSALQLSGREYPLEWQGTAWMDPGLGGIVRIKAGLMGPMEELGLKRLDSEVRYAPVKFNDIQEPQWLPLLATVDAETVHQHWKNVHQFSGYRLFSVETDSRIKDLPTN